MDIDLKLTSLDSGCDMRTAADSFSTGRYPERVLADQIYRTRKNRAYCKRNGIRMSGPALGRPRQMTSEEKKQSYTDNSERIEIDFSRCRRQKDLSENTLSGICFCMGF